MANLAKCSKWVHDQKYACGLYPLNKRFRNSSSLSWPCMVEDNFLLSS